MDVVGDVSPWDDSALVDREGLSQVGKDVRRHCFREQAVIRVGHCDGPGVFRRVVQDFGDEDPQAEVEVLWRGDSIAEGNQNFVEEWTSNSGKLSVEGEWDTVNPWRSVA